MAASTGTRGTLRKASVPLFAAIALLLLGAYAPSADATLSHHFAGKLDPGIDPVYPAAPCHVWDMDVDASENVYVLCGGSTQGNNYGSGAVVKRFDKNGNPVPFTANESYIQGNTLIEDPYPEAVQNEFGKTFQNQGKLAVDTSSGPTAGYLYVITGNHLDVIKPSGEFAGTLSPTGAFGINSVAADAEGNVYYNSGFKIDKRDKSLTVVGQLYASAENSFADPADHDMAFDSTGAVWGIGEAHEDFPLDSVARYEKDQFGPPEQESSYSLGQHHEAKLSPLVESPLVGFGTEAVVEGDSIAVDRSNDDLYVKTAGEGGFEDPEGGPQRILQFSRGTLDEPSHQIAAPIGDGSNVGTGGFFSGNQGIAVGTGGTVFVSDGAKVSKFVAGGPLPTVRDHRVALADVGHEDVTVRAKVELEGGGPVTGCEVVYGKTRNYGEPAVPCSPSTFGSDTEVSADLTGLETEQTYHWAVIAKNAEGSAYGIDRTLRPAAVLNAETEAPTEVTDSTATFNASLDPDNEATTYHFAYGLAGDLTDTTEEITIEGNGIKHFSVPVTKLTPGKEYKVRLVATNLRGTTEANVLGFNVAGPPGIAGVHATNVRSEEADLEAQINPIGYPTTYKFEYGLTTSYGNQIPVAPAEGVAGEAEIPTSISQHLPGLEAGRSYHFRLVAANKWGTSTSDDTTFNFLPETCPNEHVRQQMKSSFLPDCRAYELVSPGNAGGVQIYPGDEIYLQGAGFPYFVQIESQREIQNTGLANNPPRFAYYGGLGSIAGVDSPNAFLDQYTATRTDQGWTTAYSGALGSEKDGTGHKTCSVSLDKCLDHFLQNPFNPNPEYGSGYENPRNGGWIYNLAGKKIGPNNGAAPTSFEEVENGLRFIGDIRNSPDLSHLAFSSRNAIFAEGGQTAEPGSAYDNNLETGEITLISELPNGEPLPGGGEGPYQFITIPPTGVSEDGSHILMETKSPEGGHRLYMSIDDAPALEISEGKGVKFLSMSSNGGKIVFLAKQELVEEDEDESADVYMWQEDGSAEGSLTLITQGNSDTCKSSWTEKCSAEALTTQRGDRRGFSGENPGEEMEYQDVTLGGMDSKIASTSGGLFFFSPESLAGSAPRNGKNLYFANDGQVYYVATLAGAQTIDRVQISPDGEHTGFLTRAKLTSYENEGFEEMYSYTPATGKLICASCIPDGQPPTADVEASQNGPFMSDDGRVFFASADPLVPSDADPYHIPDVYEYVGGRAQLISSGTSSNGKASGGAAQFYAKTLGLESVSSSGQDVYFSSTDSMVPQDANGNSAKIYDARTNGGFEVPEEAAPCVAADECHGAGAAVPQAMQVGTGSKTNGGNVPASTQKHKKMAKAKKHKKAKKKKRHHKAAHGRGGNR